MKRLALLIGLVLVATMAFAQEQPGNPQAWYWLELLAPVLTVLFGLLTGWLKTKIGDTLYVTIAIPLAAAIAAFIVTYLSPESNFWTTLVLGLVATWLHQVGKNVKEKGVLGNKEANGN